MTALTPTAFRVLNNLAVTLGVEPRFATSSGDAASDVNGWLGSVLADSNNSPQMVALRASLKASLGSNVALTEADFFSYYFALLSASPATIWGANLIQWCRADLGSSAVSLPDQSGSGNDYAGTCTPTAADATLNLLPTLSTNGTTQSLASALNLPQASVSPSCVLAVAKFGAFAGTQSWAIDSADASHFCSFGAFNSTQCFFANGNTNLTLNMSYGAWNLIRSDYSAALADIHTAGTNSRIGSAQNHAPAAGRIIGAPTNGQQIQWFELIWLNCIPSRQDLFLYKGYLDALTANSVLHT